MSHRLFKLMKRCRSQQAKTSSAQVLPSVVVEEILLNLPVLLVVMICRLVCREWKELIDGASHWKERCRREGFKLHNISKPPANWRLFYFLSKKRRNLLKNPRADYGLRGWELVQNGDDGWDIGDVSVKLPDESVTKFFVTSYCFCIKRQLIDLKKEGYSPALMDHWQTHIKISDWYAPRWDCKSVYKIFVELLDQNQTVIRHFQPEPVVFPQWSDQQWCQITHVFKDYGPGVRFIRFTHGGMVTQFSADRCAILVTNSSVKICPAAEG